MDCPKGKRLTGFSGRCRFPTARLSPTHNNLCVALLLQIMFAGVSPVRCAPPLAAMNFICRWRGPLPLCTSCRGCASQPKLAPSLPIKEALIKSLSAFILEFLCNARNGTTRIASYLRSPMTKQCIKILIKADSMD